MRSICHVRPSFITTRLSSIFDSIQVSAAGVNVLTRASVIRTITRQLRHCRVRGIMLSAIVLTGDNSPLLSPSTITALHDQLLPRISLVAPGLPRTTTLLSTPRTHARRRVLRRKQSLLTVNYNTILVGNNRLSSRRDPS